MKNEEKEFQEFMLELTNKANEIKEKYKKLSEVNKLRVQANMKPIIDIGIAKWLFENHQ